MPEVLSREKPFNRMELIRLLEYRYQGQNSRLIRLVPLNEGWRLPVKQLGSSGLPLTQQTP